MRMGRAPHQDLGGIEIGGGARNADLDAGLLGDGTPAGSLIAIRANDFAEAKAIVDSDPFHKSGLRSYTLRRWTVNEGTYGLRVNYSDRTVTIE
jgi:hypothetical protein